MYLSRVEIDYDNRRLSRQLNHLGAFHNWVEQSFPEEFEKNIRSRKLWRIDTLNQKQYLLVVSEKKPDLSRLEKYGKKSTAESKSYDEFLDSLEKGQKVKFRLVLNPIVSRIEDKKQGGRGRVFPLIKEFDQLNYLYKRAEKNGFSLEKNGFYLLKSSFEEIKRQNKKSLKIVKAEYQGELTIIDKEKFIDTLTNGMGKKKAYGFGMMTVIPMG